MTLIRITFTDQIGIDPIKEELIECDLKDSEVAIAISTFNATKWRKSPDFEEMKGKVMLLGKCELVKAKETIVGGYTGGPIGRRKFVFPAVYESPAIEVEEPNKTIKCLREGSHLNCALYPDIL